MAGFICNILTPQDNKQTVIKDPGSGRHYDLEEMLENQRRVTIITLEGTRVTVEKTRLTRFNGTYGAGLRFTIRCFGRTIRGNYGTCKQHFTAWDRIDPNRDGLYWRFAFDDAHHSPFDERVLVRTVI